jgi:4'-phosphopantetheinyl transferase
MKWKTVTEPLKIGALEFHIWRVRLDVSSLTLERLFRFLSPEEKARAERFVFPRDREHFIVARGTLRELLGRYLEIAPEQIELRTNERGKPALRDNPQSKELHFNVSHSHGTAAYVFSGEGQVGIDVEKIRSGLEIEEIAQRYFSPSEIRELQSLPKDLRDEGFFLCWTRKEAYIKARGEGLRIPLRSFEVSLTPGEPAVLRSEDSEQWNLYSFNPFPGFVATCVVPCSAKEIRLLESNLLRSSTQY